MTTSYKTLSGEVFDSIPFFDQKKVIYLLDNLHGMDEGSRVANVQILMIMMSSCVLQEGFDLTV